MILNSNQIGKRHSKTNEELYKALQPDEGTEREISLKEFEDLGLDDWVFELDIFGFISFTLRLWHLALWGVVIAAIVYLFHSNGYCDQPMRPAEGSAAMPDGFLDPSPHSSYVPARRRMLGRKLPTARKDPFRDLKVTLETLEEPLPNVDASLPGSYVDIVSLSDDLGAVPGLNDNMWWLLPISCVAQLLWIFVAYKICKRYNTTHAVKSKQWERYVLREITIRR